MQSIQPTYGVFAIIVLGFRRFAAGVALQRKNTILYNFNTSLKLLSIDIHKKAKIEAREMLPRRNPA
jgi:hypothetical protein